MVVEYIRYTIDTDRAEAFEQAYRRAAEALEASEHCERYEVARCREEATQHIVRIEWDSEDGHLSGFRQSPEFRSFFHAVGPFVRDIEEMHHYQVTLSTEELGEVGEEKPVSDGPASLPDPRLTAIAGQWRTSGYVIGDPQLPVVGTDIYEVFPGGHFLVHHVDVTVGGRSVRAIEIIGEPDGESGYLGRSYDSDGNAEVMHLRIDDDGVFHFVGGGEIAPAAQPHDTPTARVRSTLTLASDRASMTARWERSEDGMTWHPWMDIRFTRH